MRLSAAVAMLLAGLVEALPASVNAQTPGKIRRIGWLGISRIDTPQLIAFRDAFRDELRRRGWQEGRDYVLVYRFGERHPERFPQLARELVEAGVDVILTIAADASRAARDATRTIPIVVTGVNALASGLVLNVGRPEGNVTGVSEPIASDLWRKRVQLLAEAFPSCRRIGFLPSQDADANRSTRLEAEQRGLTLVEIDVRRPEDILPAIDRERDVDAWFVGSHTYYLDIRQALVDRITKTGRPAMYGSTPHFQLGGLMAYGWDFSGHLVVAARQIDRILRGTRVADVPVEQATQVGLMLNLRTAKAIGITFPPSMLLRAEIVE